MTASCSVLGLQALLSASPVLAQALPAEPATAISLPPGSLDDMLVELSRQTGASIGMSGRLPADRTKGVVGTLSVGEALHRLLAGTGLRAVRVGATAWRVEMAPMQSRQRISDHAPASAEASEAEVPVEDIVVTAAKQSRPLATTPISSTVVESVALFGFELAPTSATIGALVDGMALSSIGPGRNRVFLRGIGDSPFNGTTQSTVATLVDDARITFNAPDPDLRLIDIDRVEILKGPQGPLYGSGALGGVFRIVTRRPQLDAFDVEAGVSGQVISHGGTGPAGQVMVNVPIKQDSLGLRAVGYAGHEPGWIDNLRPGGDNSNWTNYTGGRLALRWQTAPDWNVDLVGMVQLLHVGDTQYLTTGPGFRRSGVAPEPHDNDFYNARMTVTGRLGAVDVLSATSWTTQEVDSTLDASPAAEQFGLTGLVLFSDDHRYNVFDQEFRLSSEAGKLRWLVGASYLSASTRVDGELQPEHANGQTVGALDEHAEEFALYGEMGLPLTRTLNVDAGIRAFHARVHDEQADFASLRRASDHRTGISPSLSLSLTPDSQSFYYARIATAFRPRGLSAFAPIEDSNNSSDELSSVELGGRWHSADRHLTAKVELYGTLWSDIQTDYLLPNGLVASRIGGNGTIYGVEATGNWTFAEKWSFDAGFDAQHAQIEKGAPGAVAGSDTPLQVVPDYKGHFSLTRSFELGPWQGEAALRGNVVGSSSISINPQTRFSVGHHATVDSSLAIRRDHWRVGVSVQNITNRSDDSFAFGNPFSIPFDSQHTPLRPRRFLMSLTWSLSSTG